MTFAELTDRARQGFYLGLELSGLVDARDPSNGELLEALLPDLRRSCGSLEEWWQRHRTARSSFFSSLDNHQDTLRALDETDETYRATVISRAEAIVNGEFDLLGYTRLPYGMPPSSWLEIVSGIRSPDAHWSRIDYLDRAVVGDHKLVWELNRHQWIVTLAQTWWLKRDPRYADAALLALTAWMDENPPKRGINWASSLEVAFRAISWVWTLRFLADAPGLTAAVASRLVRRLLVSGRHIERYLSTYFSPNTHLTGEALGLFYLGLELAEFESAVRWRNVGSSILLSQLGRHVRSDGTYFEQTTWYHRYTLDFYTHFLILSERAGLELPDTVRETVSRLATFLAAVMRPDGKMPLIGDDDGGRLLQLDGLGADDARPALAEAAVVTRRPDLAYVAQKPFAELVWLLGAPGLAEFKGLEQRPPMFTSCAFTDGGFYVLRDGWHGEANVMAVDAGVHGVMRGGHAHADALSFDLTLGGRELFVDPGTYSYVHDPEARDYLRSTAAHNTVEINGTSSSLMQGPFSWGRFANCRVNTWLSTPPADYLDAEHDGYERTAGARHRRQILFLRPDCWIVDDRVECTRSCSISVRLHCAVGLEASVNEGGGSVSVLRDGGPLASVAILANSGTLTVEESYVSPRYGLKFPAPVIHFSARSDGKARVVTVITPANRGLNSLGWLAEDPGAGISFSREDSSDAVWLDEEKLEARGIESDARVLWLRREAGTGRIVQWIAVGARVVIVNGEVLHRADVSSDVWGGAGFESGTSLVL
jgi:hypothetical protein